MAKAASKQVSKPPKSLFTLTEENRKKLPVVAAIEGTNMQEIVNRSLQEYFERYEKKNGKIPTK